MPLRPYPDPDARDRELRALADELGAEVVTYGHSVEGRPLLAVGLGRGPRRVVVSANIHGLEFVGNRVAVAFLRSLPGSALAGRAEVWVAPCLNPDGYARTWEREGRGRVGELRTNARGVDLNRNFPLPWSRRPSIWPGSGSMRPGDSTWRGEAPLSEPESRALAAFLEHLAPHAAVGLHSFMGTVIPPCCTHRDDRRVYADLARTFAAHQRGARYRRLSSAVFDVFTGELEDWLHHVLRAWAVCVEVFSVGASLAQNGPRAESAFWRFNPRDPDRWATSDVPAVHALLLRALERERPPERPGAADCLPTWTGSAADRTG